MAIHRNEVDESKFNLAAVLPFEPRLKDFDMAMQDVYDFFYDVNVGLVERSPYPSSSGPKLFLLMSGAFN